MPRKRSTNTAALSTAISSIKQSINPILHTSSVRTNPKAIKTAIDQWTSRTVRGYTNIPTSQTDGAVRITDIVGQTGLVGGFAQIRVLGVKVWNITNQAGSQNFIRVSSDPAMVESGLSTSVEDIGNASSLPGVMIKFPRTLASNFAGGSTQTAFTIKTINPLTVTQNYCWDVNYEYKFTSAN